MTHKKLLHKAQGGKKKLGERNQDSQSIVDGETESHAQAQGKTHAPKDLRRPSAFTSVQTYLSVEGLCCHSQYAQTRSGGALSEKQINLFGKGVHLSPVLLLFEVVSPLFISHMILKTNVKKKPNYISIMRDKMNKDNS